jgi:hypothetical protein
MMRQPRSEIYGLTSLGVMAAVLASCAAPHPSTAPGRAAIRARVERASTDDCAIIAEIGKSELHWSGAVAPQAPIYLTFNTPDGGSYVEDCPWGKLHLATPTIGTPDSAMGFFISRPVFSATGASAYFQYSVAPIATADGKKIPPFLERELCTLEKEADRWHLTGCKLTSIG